MGATSEPHPHAPVDPAAIDPAAIDPVRRLELEGAWNFRDVGGYLGRDGRRVRWRRLFRADGLDRLTPADLQHIAGLRLRTVVDLRTGDEVAKGRMATADDGVSWHHLPMLDVLPPRDRYDDWVTPAHVADQYVGMMTSGAGTVTSFLRLVCDPDRYPLVFHCFAGKDRTGILTALILGLLGVADDDIAADYALSAAAMHHLLAWLRGQYDEGGAELDVLESSAAAIVAAEPETMAEFLRQFRRAHGSFDAYAAGLGHPDAADRLRAILLEP
jgi:protein tyrosine/serine phosphatase